MTTLLAAIPARLRALLRGCLIGDPRQRLRGIGEAHVVLDKMIAGAPQRCGRTITGLCDSFDLNGRYESTQSGA